MSYINIPLSRLTSLKTPVNSLRFDVRVYQSVNQRYTVKDSRFPFPMLPRLLIVVIPHPHPHQSFSKTPAVSGFPQPLSPTLVLLAGVDAWCEMCCCSGFIDGK